MSRARTGTGRAVLRSLALAGGIAVVMGASFIGLGGADLFPSVGSAPGSTGLDDIPGWVWGLALGALPSGAALAWARVLKTKHQRSLAVLLRQARRLDEVNRAGATIAAVGEAAPGGLAGEVWTAMSLSAARMQSQLVQERTFSGQAAHQLRTPLTALGLQIEELTMHPETPRQVRADLHRARNEVDRLADVISDLLALARRGALPSGRYQTDPAVVAVHATHRWASSAQLAGRQLRVSGTLPACSVPAPAGPAAQVLDVLIDNALKHGAGDIEVSVAVLPDAVRLRVADEGTGAPGAPRGASTAGEGMGLQVAQRLAAACGGQMVRVLQPTTAFDLLLPRYRPEQVTDELTVGVDADRAAAR